MNVEAPKAVGALRRGVESAPRQACRLQQQGHEHAQPRSTWDHRRETNNDGVEAGAIVFVAASSHGDDVNHGCRVAVVGLDQGVVVGRPQPLVRVLVRLEDKVHTVLVKQILQARSYLSRTRKAAAGFVAALRCWQSR